MDRRTFLAAAAWTPLVGLVASSCTVTGLFGESDPEVILERSWCVAWPKSACGLVITVTSDGRVFTPADDRGGSGFTVFSVRTLSNEGLERLVDAVEEAALLTEIDFGRSDVQDAAVTRLRLRIDGEEYRHSVYALGWPGPRSAERQALIDFFARLDDLPGLVGASNIGEPEPVAAPHVPGFDV